MNWPHLQFWAPLNPTFAFPPATMQTSDQPLWLETGDHSIPWKDTYKSFGNLPSVQFLTKIQEFFESKLGNHDQKWTLVGSRTSNAIPLHQRFYTIICSWTECSESGGGIWRFGGQGGWTLRNGSDCPHRATDGEACFILSLFLSSSRLLGVSLRQRKGQTLILGDAIISKSLVCKCVLCFWKGVMFVYYPTLWLTHKANWSTVTSKHVILKLIYKFSWSFIVRNPIARSCLKPSNYSTHQIWQYRFWGIFSQNSDVL